MTRNKKKTAAPKKYASTPRDHPSTVVFSWRLARTLRFKDLAGNGISPGKIGTSSSGIGGSLKMVYPVYPQSHCQALPFQSCHWHTMDVWNPWMFGIHGCFNMFHFSKVFPRLFEKKFPLEEIPVVGDGNPSFFTHPLNCWCYLPQAKSVVRVLTGIANQSTPEKPD